MHGWIRMRTARDSKVIVVDWAWKATPASGNGHVLGVTQHGVLDKRIEKLKPSSS